MLASAEFRNISSQASMQPMLMLAACQEYLNAMSFCLLDAFWFEDSEMWQHNVQNLTNTHRHALDQIIFFFLQCRLRH